MKQFNAEGEAIRVDREIDEDQAEVVRRIFHEYAHENKSPRAIASDLNSEDIPCPSGKSWGQSTINGNRRRGTGILNNHLYIGELIWNRQHFIKDPATGRRVTRLNDEAEWIRQDVPDLRIVDQDLWEAAKARQKSDMTKLAREKENIIQAIKDGVPASIVKDELEQVSAKLDELASSMNEQDQGQKPLIHPSMARRYREQIENLRGLLEGGQAGQAREHVREAIDKIVLTPKEDSSELAIDLYGSLAGILKIASEDKSMKNKAVNKKRLAGLVANDNYSSEPSVCSIGSGGRIRIDKALFG